ncbi:MAG: 5'-deoxyadenosine deaminase [Planctomycetes bacterium]|nr:5'-deoxyadenosine deaminase [Planctomycetota bacterium]
MSLLVKNALLVTMDASRRVFRGDLLAEGEKILRVGVIAGRDMVGLSKLSVLDGTGLWCLPGLVQTHVHLCQTLFRNQAEELPLLDWLQQRIWPLEAALDEDALDASARLGIAELFASGTTCILDMGTVRHTDVLFEAAKQTGLRFIGGKAMMDDPASFPALRELSDDSLAESDRLASRWDGKENGRLRYAYAPRFALSCSDRLLRAVGERVAGGGRLHTHASESAAECEIVRTSRGMSNIRYLERTGLCGARSVLAHCVHPAEGELGLLAETDTAVAHCPSSNLKLGSGIAPVPDMIARGIRVGLGADGAPCNNWLDAFTEMRLAALLPKPRSGPAALPAAKIVEMATIGGAAALGLEHETGSLEVGKQADLVLVDPRGLHATPGGDDIYTTVVHALRASDVRATVAAGTLVYRDGELKTMNADAVRRRAEEQWGKVRKRAGL